VSDSAGHSFPGSRRRDPDNTLGYRAGETHPVLIFVREQPGASPDIMKAAAELAKRGWSDVKISEAALVAGDALDSVHPQARATYETAVNDGFEALVFSEPVTPTDLTNR
jgi:hypothetical protein